MVTEGSVAPLLAVTEPEHLKDIPLNLLLFGHAWTSGLAEHQLVGVWDRLQHQAALIVHI